MSLPLRNALIKIALLAAINFLVIGSLFGSWVAFNVIRVLLTAWAGWYVVFSSGTSLRVAAIAGVLVMVVDHVLLKGGLFLISDLFAANPEEGSGILAFLGVLVSFVMYAPLAALLGLAGGWYQQRRVKHASATP